MLCSIESKFIIGQATSRVAGEFFDGDYPTKYFKSGKIGKCSGLGSQAGIQISPVNTVSERRIFGLYDFCKTNNCHPEAVGKVYFGT